MVITKNTHYFKGSELYYLKDVLPYIKKMNSKLDIPNCWYQGGSLNEKVRTEYGITPAWENGYEGRGHREKYTGSQMYKIAENLTNDLKAGIIKRRQSRSLTPIEALASDNKISADEFSEAFGGSDEDLKREVLKNPVDIKIYPVSTKEELQKALSEAADTLVKQFQNFIDQVIKAYMTSI